MISSTKKDYTYQIVIIGILFFTFGFVTWLNGTLIQFLKIICELKTDTQSFLVTFAFFISYAILAIPSSRILQRTGYKMGMSYALIVMALGSLIFIPAANMRSFELFLTGLFVQGMGLALLQTASNPYISNIGTNESAASRISMMGICNKVAGALSPLILGFFILSNSSDLESSIKTATDVATRDQILNDASAKIITPYIALAIALFLLAGFIWRSRLPEIQEEETSNGNLSKSSSASKMPRYVILGALCIFMYVGAEVMAGDLIGFYGKKLGFGLDQTRFFTTLTLLAMLLGYVASIITIPKILSQEASLKWSAILGILITIAVYFSDGKLAVGLIACLGIANAPMWPAIFPLGIRNLGSNTKLGSAFLVMGIAGGAVIPQLYGRFIDAHFWDFKTGFLFTMLLCYVYVLWYGVKGFKIE